VIKKAISVGNLEKKLEGKPIDEVFRRRD